MAKENELIALAIIIILMTVCVWILPNAPIYGAMLGLSIIGMFWGWDTGRKNVLLVSFFTFSIALTMLFVF